MFKNRNLISKTSLSFVILLVTVFFTQGLTAQYSTSRAGGESKTTDTKLVDNYLKQQPAADLIPQTASFNEGFNNISTLVPAGWFFQNNSMPVGLIPNWIQGDSTVFPAQSGSDTTYVGCSFNSVAGANTISNWMLTPQILLHNGDQFKFWTRKATPAPTDFPDRMQIRLSTNGASTNVGATNTSVGDFTTLLLDINSTQVAGGYPIVWTQYTITISGLATPTNGRLAFRYFVTNAGPSGANSDYIGVDTFQYIALPPTAANVSVGGRIFNANGTAVSNAQISMIDANGNVRQARSNPFGYYRFTEVAVGSTYTIIVGHKFYEFAPRVLSVVEDSETVDFVASS